MTDEPTFDKDGYPTDETLERIRTWPLVDITDYEAVMDYAGAAWSYPEAWHKAPLHLQHPQRVVLHYEFSTGGWSGNESIVGAIEDNHVLQAIGAYSWRRGGHYEYRFPLPGKDA